MRLRLTGHRTTRYMLHATCYTLHVSYPGLYNFTLSCYMLHILPETEGFCFIFSEDEFFRRRRCSDFAFVTKEKKTKETKHMVPRTFPSQRITRRVPAYITSSSWESWWRTLFQVYEDVVQYLQCVEVTCPYHFNQFFLVVVHVRRI